MPLIFLIGPGGVGKTTAGRLLAEISGVTFIDLDDEFCDRIGNIRSFIKAKGYEDYVVKNSALGKEVVDTANDAIIVLSSGFLVTDTRPDILEKNRALVRRSGHAVLLLPHQDMAISTEIVVGRQLKRGFGLVRDREIRTFQQRYPEYLKLSETRIFSSAPPQEVAVEIKNELQKKKLLSV